MARQEVESKLLLDEVPLVVLPKLAVTIGLNEAIVLQQLHFWLRKSKHVIKGRLWIFNTIDQWHEQFPFFSQSTIRRTLANLEKQHKLITTDRFNKKRYDKTKWYTINYKPLLKMSSGSASDCSKWADACVQNEQMDVVKLNKPIPENTIDHSENGRLTKKKKTVSSNVIDVENIYQVYADLVKPDQQKTYAINNIRKRCKEYSQEQLVACTLAYCQNGMKKDVEFRYEARNFFGIRKAYFRGYLNQASSFLDEALRLLAGDGSASVEKSNDGKTLTMRILDKKRKESGG